MLAEGGRYQDSITEKRFGRVPVARTGAPARIMDPLARGDRVMRLWRWLQHADAEALSAAEDGEGPVSSILSSRGRDRVQPYCAAESGLI